jgi:hypothetical protein
MATKEDRIETISEQIVRFKELSKEFSNVPGYLYTINSDAYSRLSVAINSILNGLRLELCKLRDE